jgi:hypothetical protein
VRRIGTWTAAAVLGAGLLSGCSGGGDTEAYCDGLKDAESAFSGNMDASAIEEISDTIGDLADDAPEEVSDDWETLDNAYGDFEDALEDAGLSTADLEDPEKLQGLEEEDMQKIQEATEAMGTDDVSEATDNIEKHAKDECDVDLGS